ncbi:hypothetical protein AX16_009435 [Volvariella volvacea WC 439]|nr:hypothetical protein AX16_009435 [Volvariella volvacea WC 439]
MLLASLFLAAFAHSYASPVPATIPGSTIPSPICVVAAAMTASRCDPTRTRTISDILYSCISVILLCTYISIHHNIPDQGDSWVKATWMKIRTSLYALIAPEMILMWAIRQRIMAGRIAEKNKDRGWTRTHGFFVQMGGLVQRQSNLTYKVLCKEGDINGAKIPHIPEKEIMDHGKGDLLAKALVVVQTTWFVAQCIARHLQGLVLTEIELVTLAFATLNVITYGLWWDKPLNVGYPIYFDENGTRIDGPQAEGDEGQVEEDKGAWYERIRGSMSESWKEWGPWAIIAAPFAAVFSPLADMIEEEGNDSRPTSVLPFYAAWMSEGDRNLAVVYGSVIGVLFGGIHLVGWNFQFSTTTELWLWRVSSLVLVIVPLFLAIAYAFDYAYSKLHIKILGTVGVAFLAPALLLGPPLYFAARIILLFLAFFSLRCLPESAYQNVRWTEYLPHI